MHDKGRKNDRLVKSPKKKAALTAPRSDCSSVSILVHPERCTGCGACEAVCSAMRTERRDREQARPAIRVGRTLSDGSHVPLTCAVCTNTVCAAVCPGDVLSRQREFGLVAVRPESCSGCGGCILSCPFGVLHMGGRKPVPHPCDLCGGNVECVKSCPTGALERIDLSDEQTLATKRASVEKLAELTGLE